MPGICIRTQEGCSNIIPDITEAMKELKPGSTVDCYNEEGVKYGSFGLVRMGEVKTAVPPTPTPIVTLRCTSRGNVGVFGTLQSVAYRLGLKMQVDSREREEYGWGVFKTIKERVMFTVTGSDDKTEEFRVTCERLSKDLNT